jgi:hypothetical protein
MSKDWPTHGTAPEIGQHVLDCIDQFLEKHSHKNRKNWEDLKDRLLRWVQSLDPDLAFSGLLWILETQTSYQYQLVTGELLDRASLKSSVPLPDLLEKIVPKFEESAHTVPKFLSKSFGRDPVVECLREMRRRTSSARTAGKIDTLLYWLRSSRITE